MTILTEGHKMWPEYIQLQKCGSISLGLNFNLLGLNCFFCSTICTKLEEFKKHIQKQHTKELQELYEAFETKNVDEEIAIKIEPCLYLQDGACDIFEDELQEHNFDKEDEKEEDMSLKTEMPSTSKMSRGSKNVTTKVETINTLESDNEHREPDHEIFSSLNKNEYKSSNENASSDEDNSVSERNMDDDFLTESEMDSSKTKHREHREPRIPKIDVNSPENQLLVSHIIQFYEKSAHLYNTTHKEHKNRFILLKDLETELQNQFQIQLDVLDIDAIFNKLRVEYRSYCRRNPSAEDSSEPKSWYFDKLLFLPSSTKTKNRLSNRDFIAKIMDIYEKYPCLWNMSDETSSNKKIRQKALENMLKELAINATLSELKVNITRMKNQYVAEKTKRIQCEQENQTFEPKNSEIYNKLHFIDSYVGPFRCHHCGNTLRSYEEHQIHIAKHEDRKPFHCRFCQKPYSTLIGVHHHTMREHETTEKLYPCKYCDRTFVCTTDLKSHKNSHVEEMKFVCELCGKFFHSKNYYTDHLAKHNKRYKCALCPMGYSDKYRYESHMNSHNKIRAFVCDICGKGFYSQKTMAQHKLLHGDVEKYECNLCGRRFKQVAAMHSHKKWFHQRINSQETMS